MFATQEKSIQITAPLTEAQRERRQKQDDQDAGTGERERRASLEALAGSYHTKFSR